MKRCLFCEDPPHRNREHIIAQKLYERMCAESFDFCVGAYRQGEGTMRRGVQRFKTYVTNHVCRKCNNGWMSALESWFLKTAGLLVEPDWPRLARDAVEMATREHNTLCQWLLKTAITAEQNSFMRNRIVPAWLRPLAKSGKLNSDICVDLGYSKHTTVALFLTKGFPVHNGRFFFSNQVHEDGFSFTLQLNHLLLRLMHIPSAEPIRTSAHAEISTLVVQAQNYRDYNNVLQFMDSIYLRTWLTK